MLLELGRRRALDRPVAAVVHPRRELVDHQPAAPQLEQLDRQQPDEVEAADEPVGDLAGVAGHERVDRGGRDALDEDARVVDVARRPGTSSDRPVAVAGADDRQLGLEVDLALQEQRAGRPAAERRHRGLDPVRVRDPDLAAAVVPAERHLEPATGSRAPRRRPRASSTPRTSRHGAAHSPISRMNRRSASRSLGGPERGQPGAQRRQLAGRGRGRSSPTCSSS